MKEDLAEEQLDILLRRLVSETSADEATVIEIADSRTTWWAIRRRINDQRYAARSAWPPRPKLLRWLLIGAPATALVLLAIFFAAFRPAADLTVSVNNVAVTSETLSNPVAQPETEGRTIAAGQRQPERVVVKTTNAQRQSAKPTTSTPIKSIKQPTEIKTEFIALSYAQSPESGQIVRVRVPSSMMVQLGLVSSVDKPSSLVNAEVIVGDDGLTHAIRFIK